MKVTIVENNVPLSCKGTLVNASSFGYEGSSYTPYCNLVERSLYDLSGDHAIRTAHPSNWNYVEFMRQSHMHSVRADVYTTASGDYFIPCGAGMIMLDAMASKLLNKLKSCTVQQRSRKGRALEKVKHSSITAYSKCDCGAITLTIDGEDYSVSGKRFSEFFPSIDLRHYRGKKRLDMYACNHCVNHYGLDLCGCGSGALFGKCKEGHDECGKPMQALGERSRVNAGWLAGQ